MKMEKLQQKPHGIMFHHFCDDYRHIRGQGSLTAERFEKLLAYYQRTHNIITAEAFLQRSEAGRLQPEDVCLTFDDGLLCQYDIAFPVLKAYGLTAFWFIYTSPMDGVLEKIEIYRHFRFSCFPDIDAFYTAFFKIVSKRYPDSWRMLESYDPAPLLREFPFYTVDDLRFRYLRNTALGETVYNRIMDEMLESFGYNTKEASELLWMKPDQILTLHREGNIIGLHSHSHPSVLTDKGFNGQLYEYKQNKERLESIIEERISSVSYPCNSYDSDTLICMKELGIKIGFRANMADVCIGEPRLEFAREDHANIIRAMEEAE